MDSFHLLSSNAFQLLLSLSSILPLTPLIYALRAVILEGTSVLQLPQAAILGAWGIVTFVLALRWFRWV